jgi:hypothetical protein
MKTIVQISAAILLGYLFWAYGLPWIQRNVGQSRAPVSNPAEGRGGECVQAAAQASDRLYEDILAAGRELYDDADWGSRTAKVDDLLHQARFACSCRLQSCVAAREAISRLQSLFQEARVQPRASQSVPLDQGRAYEQANELLWRAYDLARDGK